CAARPDGAGRLFFPHRKDQSGGTSMRRVRLFLLPAGALAVALAVTASGCGTKKDEDEDAGPVRITKATASKELTELAGKGKGTLSGRVTLDGQPPDVTKPTDDLHAQMEAQGDKAICKTGDTSFQKWKISPDGGVANVFV